MKTFSQLALIAVILSGFSVKSASAWPWSKLDLNSIQGTYNLVVKQGMYLGCPDTITVTYDATNATLDSEAFHFTNIGGGSQSTGQTFDAGSASYSEQSVVTKVNSNSISETQSVDTTSSDTSQAALDPDPFQAPAPGSPESMGLAVSSGSVTTTVKYSNNTLTKSVSVDGEDAGEDCTFSRAN